MYVCLPGVIEPGFKPVQWVPDHGEVGRLNSGRDRESSEIYPVMTAEVNSWSPEKEIHVGKKEE